MVDLNFGILQRVNFGIRELSDLGWVSILVASADLCLNCYAYKNCVYFCLFLFLKTGTTLNQKQKTGVQDCGVLYILLYIFEEISYLF